MLEYEYSIMVIFQVIMKHRYLCLWWLAELAVKTTYRKENLRNQITQSTNSFQLNPSLFRKLINSHSL